MCISAFSRARARERKTEKNLGHMVKTQHFNEKLSKILTGVFKKTRLGFSKMFSKHKFLIERVSEKKIRAHWRFVCRVFFRSR